MRARTLKAVEDGNDIGQLVGAFYATLIVRGVPEDVARELADSLLYRVLPETWINYARGEYQPEMQRDVADHNRETAARSELRQKIVDSAMRDVNIREKG